MEGVLCRPISGFYSGDDGYGVFSNNDHLQYYDNNHRLRSRKSMGVRCAAVGGGGFNKENMAVVEKNSAVSAMVDDKSKKKMQKKWSKLMKGLSGDLAMLLSSDDIAGLVPDHPHNRPLQDASQELLSQLKKLQSEQKELKKKKKEERKDKLRANDCSENKIKKKKLKLKAADCSSSSSSSESSDSECERKVLDMSSLKRESNMLPPSSYVTLNQDDMQQQLQSVVQDKAFQSLTSALREETPIALSPPDSNNILLSILLEKEKETVAEEKMKKKIEVCMGGKCKRSGGGALLEEFQKVVAGSVTPDVEVVGCKCMGKCRDGPNVRLVSPPPIDGFDHNHRHVGIASASVAVAEPPLTRRRTPQASSYPLCIGVGLQDVGLIVSKLVGDRITV